MMFMRLFSDGHKQVFRHFSDLTDTVHTAPSSRKIVAWVAMLVIGGFWGSTIPLSKTATSTGHLPLGLIFWQFVAGIVLLGAYLFVRGWRPALSVEKVRFYIIVALIGTILPNGASFLAYPHLPAGVMAIAIATVPMFTFVIALLVRLERFALSRFLGLVVGFAAMVMIAAPETSLPDPALSVFVLVALIAPLCYGMEANYIAVRTPAGTDPVSTLFMASCFGFLIVTPLMLATGQWIDLSGGLGAPEQAMFAAAVVHAVTYVGYIWLVRFGGPVFSVQVAYAVTLSGLFLSIIFLGEGYSVWIWGALVLVIIGLVLVQPKLEEPETAPQS
jgi:drug/metabolite transporter (DMT)-like permease